MAGKTRCVGQISTTVAAKEKERKKYHHRKIQLLEKARENCQGSRIATGQMGTIANSSSLN